MDIPLLKDIFVILGLSVIVIFTCHKIHLPAIVGYMFTGIIAGPHGFGLVKAVYEVEILAEVGVILLLFTIGIEVSLKNLLEMKKIVLSGGLIQVILTILFSSFIASQIGLPFGESIFIGCLVSLSSTAIVLKLLQERAEVDTTHGRTTLGILIFQDIIIVPMILLTPILSGKAVNIEVSILVLLIKGFGIITIAFVSAKWIVPQLLYQIARTRNRELFLLSIIVICLAVAWLASSAGLSIALGAFLAGLIISESGYSYHTLGNILPFKDVFSSFFFVSIGMLLDVSFLFTQGGHIILIALAVLISKMVIVSIVSLFLGLSLRTSILVGIALSQMGEFSFILLKTGIEHGVLASNIYQIFLSVSVLTMATTPLIIGMGHKIADLAKNIPLPKSARSGPGNSLELKGKSIKDHIIIIGYGLIGRNVAQAARKATIPHIIIEMNPKTVKNEQVKGQPIFYGDATYPHVLKHANIKHARTIILAINDPHATRHITGIVKRLNTKVYLIARTRYTQEMKALYELGADEVIPEEFETSVEIFTRVLTRYLVPRDEIESLIAELRSDGYKMLRTPYNNLSIFSGLNFQLHNLPDIELSALKISKESLLVGKSSGQLDLRKRYKILVLAIRRGSNIIPNPPINMQFYAEDVLFLLGSRGKIAKIASLSYNSE